MGKLPSLSQHCHSEARSAVDSRLQAPRPARFLGAPLLGMTAEGEARL